jgi:hypothetical protein
MISIVPTDRGRLVERVGRATRPTWGVFGAWAVLGLVAAFLTLILGTVGLAASAVLGVTMAAVGRNLGTAWGFVTGAGVPLLWVGWLNRDGPGMVCSSIPSGTSCDQSLSPWPWVLVGLVLVTIGVGGHLQRGPSRR